MNEVKNIQDNHISRVSFEVVHDGLVVLINRLHVQKSEPSDHPNEQIDQIPTRVSPDDYLFVGILMRVLSQNLHKHILRGESSG